MCRRRRRQPDASGGYGGVLHAIIGTLEITLGAMVISVPVGLMCAVYLIEYAARGNKLAKSIGLLVDVMSGIPSIVAGLFAYSMFSLIGGPRHHQRLRRLRRAFAADDPDRRQDQ